MNPILPAAVRTMLQAWWGGLAAWLLSLGISLPEGTDQLVVNALVAAVIGLATAGIRWLETRPDSTDTDPSRWAASWPRLARKVASWLMLGMSGAQPTYTDAGKTKR